jgi:hypothetical protein
MRSVIKRILKLLAVRFPERTLQAIRLGQEIFYFWGNCIPSQASNTSKPVARKSPAPLRPLRPLRIGHLKLVPDDASPRDWVSMLSGAGVLEPRTLHEWLSFLFAKRRIGTLESILSKEIPELEILTTFHRIRLQHYRGLVEPGNDQLVERIRHHSVAPHFLHSQALNLALAQYVLTKNHVHIMSAMDTATPIERQGVPRATLMAIINILITENLQEKAAGYLTERIENTTIGKKLYFADVINKLGDEFTGPINLPDLADWRSLLAVMRAEIRDLSAEKKEEYDRYWFSPLELIPSDSDFLDVRYSLTSRNRLEDFILSACSERRSMSLIRLGDGEAYCYDAVPLSSVDDTVFEDDNETRELHWWGQNPGLVVRGEIKKRVRQAIAHADVLGVPGVHRLIRDCADFSSEIGSDRGRRGLAVVLNAVGTEIPIHGKKFTEERVHHVVFTSNYLKRLCGIAARVVVVSCWQREQFDIPWLSGAEFIKISPHTKVRDDSIEAPLFLSYEDVNEQITAAIREPGTLALIGAGLIGKIFVDTARQRGAVALDVGAVLDSMVGRKTRRADDIIAWE